MTTTKSRRGASGNIYNLRDYFTKELPIIPQALFTHNRPRLCGRLDDHSAFYRAIDYDMVATHRSGGYLGIIDDLFYTGYQLVGWLDGTCAAIPTENGRIPDETYVRAYNLARDYLEAVAAFTRDFVEQRGAA